jgi:hypothetical protein
MLTTVEGRYRNGVIELTEPPVALDESRVLVTFLGPVRLTGEVPSEDGQADETDETARQEARKRILERMRKGYNLGGGPYWRNREELYDRLERPWAGVP